MKIEEPTREEDELSPPKTPMQLIQEKKKILETYKEKIASLSKSVLENPQEEVNLKCFTRFEG